MSTWSSTADNERVIDAGERGKSEARQGETERETERNQNEDYDREIDRERDREETERRLRPRERGHEDVIM